MPPIYVTSRKVCQYPAKYGFEPFGYLRTTTKDWFTRTFDCGMFYSGDLPVYFAVFEDRGHLSAVVTNLGLDPLEELPVANMPAGTKSVSMLQPDGSWKPVDVKDGSIQTVTLPLQVHFFRFN